MTTSLSSHPGILALFIAAGLGLAAPGASAQPVDLPSAPACTAPARPTPSLTEGPFYKAHAPRRHSLVTERRPGRRIVLTGYVLTRSCRPVPGAWLDLWHADSRGAYDNAGFDLRGHEFTDEQGRYWFETIVPGEYPGRTPHFHLKVHAPGQRILTTQLYFPGEKGNARDELFNSAVLLKIERAAGRDEEPLLVGRYDFVLAMP
jgi:protocatechuate 3,4-dioxygenase beta subunit